MLTAGTGSLVSPRSFLLVLFVAAASGFQLRAATAFDRVPTRSAVLALCSSASGSSDGNHQGGLSEQVGYVHGGKYQFSSTYNVAHTLAAADNVRAQIVPAQAASHSAIPSWATFSPSPNQLQGTVKLSASQPEACVRVFNEELSWEPYFVRLVGADGAEPAAAVAVRFAPSCGDLAPRGGAANVCNPQMPYSDAVTVRLALSEHGLGYLDHVRRGGDDELSRYATRWCSGCGARSPATM